MTANREAFAALHVPGDPVLLYNVWDVGSAKAVAAGGAKAIATGSHGVAESNGFPDGEGMPFNLFLDATRRIAQGVDLPVTADFEGGFAVDAARVAEHARFKDSTFPKKSDDAASKNSPNVIELDSARASRAPVPTVMEVVPPSKVDASATGTFKMNNTGSFRTSETATHRALTGGLKQAAKTATPPTKRSPPISRKKTSTSGKYKMVPKKSLAEELLEEAKEVELSESGIYKMPKNDSLLSRLVDKLKK